MSNQFSSGLELANVLVTSDPLHQSWKAIENEKQKLDGVLNYPTATPTLHIHDTQQSDLTIVTFVTSPSSFEGLQGLVSSSTLRGRNLPDFEFLYNKSNPSFAINEVAIKLFESHYDELCLLRTKLIGMCKSSSLVIITGNSMGGCVAMLFTLWLLEGLYLPKKPPICITFGSPFVGDEQLRQCVLQFSTWSSCFLNVASINDPVPKVFLAPNLTALGTVSEASLYIPFGTYLLMSASGCACFEDPDSILQLLVATKSQSAQTRSFDYRQTLEHLKLKAFCKDIFQLAERDRGPLQASIITQLAAIFGVHHSQSLKQQQPDIDIDRLIKKMETHEHKLAIKKTKVANAAKKLNDIKVFMAYMEWYKKGAKKREIGYYDIYKNKQYPSDINVEEYKKKLSNYWEDSVAEVENKPQKEGVSFRTRWLMGGTNYRRMMEPLHIAEYYKEGGKDYKTQKRHRHFILLEKWLKEEEERKEAERIKKGETPRTGPSKSKAENVESSLNDDSCFWAHVEEARISCNLLKDEQTSIDQKEEHFKKLSEFEVYVLEALNNFAVSPDIFFKPSSFMKWWNEYNEIMRIRSSSSPLVEYMRGYRYLQYGKRG